MALDLTYRIHADEYMDHREAAGPDLDRALRELGAINRHLGGHRASIRALNRLTRDLPVGTQIRLLDVGSGGADLVEALIPWARRRRLRIRLVAADFNRETCALASRRISDLKGSVAVVAADAFELPFAPESFDFVHCALFLHHFATEEAARLLRLLFCLSRRGLVVNDLHRHPLSYRAVAWGTRLISRSAMVRHDGPISVRRGFRREELEELGGLAGFAWHLVERRWAFRFVATALK